MRDKARVPYFVCTKMKSAPFVGRTAEKFPGESGLQRSASHVTTGSWFAFDLDGPTTEQWGAISERLEASGARLVACWRWRRPRSHNGAAYPRTCP